MILIFIFHTSPLQIDRHIYLGNIEHDISADRFHNSSNGPYISPNIGYIRYQTVCISPLMLATYITNGLYLSPKCRYMCHKRSIFFPPVATYMEDQIRDLHTMSRYRQLQFSHPSPPYNIYIYMHICIVLYTHQLMHVPPYTTRIG